MISRPNLGGGAGGDFATFQLNLACAALTISIAVPQLACKNDDVHA